MSVRAERQPEDELAAWWAATKPILTKPRFSVASFVAWFTFVSVGYELLGALWGRLT